MILGRNGYLIALIITFSGILGQWLGSGLESLWWYLLGLAAMGVLIEQGVTQSQSFELIYALPATVDLGVDGHCPIHVTNASRYVLEFESRFVPDPAIHAPDLLLRWRVPPRGHATQTLRYSPRRLGDVEWGNTYARRLGLLGLVWWPRHVPASPGIRVTPQRLSSEEQRRGVQPGMETVSRQLGRGFDLLGLREYRPGDPLRAIDWKATARSRRTTVRLFAEPRHIELVLLVDCSRGSGIDVGTLTRLGCAVNVAARLAHKAILADHAVGVVTFAQQVLESVPPVTGMKGLQRVRQVLGAVATRRVEANPLAAVLEASRLVRHRTLMVLLTHIDDAGVAGQLAKAVSLLSRTHLAVIAVPLDPVVVTTTRQRAVDWFDPFIIFSAQELERQHRQNVLHLKRLGAHVITALPDALDQAVLRHYDRLQMLHAV